VASEQTLGIQRILGVSSESLSDEEVAWRKIYVGVLF
jgi:hypothetical protein